MSATSLTLYATRAGFGLPDTSPFVLKTEVQLQMAGLSYERAAAIPPQAPKGKLPYIDDHGTLVTDSTFIRAHLEHTYGVDLDAGLDAQQRAQAWAIERLLEDHLYFALGGKMKLFEKNEYGNIVPVPDGQEPRDKRWTVRAGFVYVIPLVMVVLLVVTWLK